MHPWLEDLSFLTLLLIFNSEDRCITFFTDMGLIAAKDESCMPTCPRCLVPMTFRTRSSARVHWLWVCTNQLSDLGKTCNNEQSPTNNTLFQNMRLSFQDMISLIYCFVVRHPFSSAACELTRTRSFFNKKSMSATTVSEIFSMLRQVCEVHASHFVSCLGGPGKTLNMKDMYFTRWKYHDRCLGGKYISVLVIYCKEDQEGVCVEVDKNEKLDLFSIIDQYCHPETILIPLNSFEINSDIITERELKVKHLIESRCNQKINIDLQQELLQQSLSTNLDICDKFMSQTLYWRLRMLNKSVPEQMETFLLDTRTVYAGPFTQGLKLKSFKKQ